MHVGIDICWPLTKIITLLLINSTILAHNGNDSQSLTIPQNRMDIPEVNIPSFLILLMHDFRYILVVEKRTQEREVLILFSNLR